MPRVMTISSCGSGCSIPLRHGGGSEGAEGLSGNKVTLEIEGVVDCGVGGNEALGLSLRLEPLHFPFPSSDGKVGIFNPVVVA